MNNENKIRLAFIGAGNMAQAMILGLSQHPDHPFILGISSRTRAKCEALSQYGVTIFDSNFEAADWADMIVLAVKPQQYETVLSEIREAREKNGADTEAAWKRKLWISIAAGVSTSSISRQLGMGADIPIIRAMPNTPMLLGEGSTALARNAFVSEEAFRLAKIIFSSSGTVMELPEDSMNAVIAATGSAPAYIYLIIKAIFDEARAQGVDSPALMENICQMVRGAADMAQKSPDDLDTLIKRVCSPGGTTERAMQVLMERDAAGIFALAMRACTDRAEELSRQY